MPRIARSGPSLDYRSELYDRFRSTIRGLVAAKRGDRRIYLGTVAKILTEADEANHYPKLYGYLNGNRGKSSKPNMAAAYDLGEALRRAGIAWMSGFIMLYVAGNLPDVIGTLAAFFDKNIVRHLKPRPLSLEQMQAVWRFYLLCPALSRYTLYDEDPRISEIHVRNDVDLRSSLSTYMKVDRELSSPNSYSNDERVLSLDDSLVREHAKRLLMQRVWPLIDHADIESAYELWRSRRRKGPPVSVLDDAYHIAKVRVMTLGIQEETLQRLS